jgi:hypothetical protein
LRDRDFSNIIQKIQQFFESVLKNINALICLRIRCDARRQQ